MAEDPKNTKKEFPGCCKGMPFADMMRKMMEGKGSRVPAGCAEMMSRMMQMCCGAGEKKETPAQEPEKNPVSNP